MPIYEFVCQNCGHEFEHIQSFSDVSAPACTNCESREVVRRLGRPAIHFKGSGWYITDSKRSNSASSADKSSESSDSGEKVEKKSETKNETKSESAKESTTPAAAD